MPRLNCFYIPKFRVERIVKGLTGPSRRVTEVHREAWRYDEVAADFLDAKQVEFASKLYCMFVMERRIATRYVKVSVNYSGGFIELPICPDGRSKTMIGLEACEVRPALWRA